MLKSRRFRWSVHIDLMGKKRTLFRVLMGLPSGRRIVGQDSVGCARDHDVSVEKGT